MENIEGVKFTCRHTLEVLFYSYRLQSKDLTDLRSFRFTAPSSEENKREFTIQVVMFCRVEFFLCSSAPGTTGESHLMETVIGQ